MACSAIAMQRLASQQVAQPIFERPGDVVQWLGAVQAQDYLGALWAVGLRMPQASERQIEQALAEKQIVRTWPMRGTIHFVSPADARWMLELLTPRVVQNSQGRLRQLGLDAQIIAASAEVIAKALQGGKQFTRPALYEVLETAGIAAGEQRGLHILGQLAHQRVLCFGARAGKQPTFTLFDEWLPNAPSLPREEALATLALRYFTSHGPATLHDFIWWAGLTVADAKAGVAAVAGQLACVESDEQHYYAAQELHDAPNALNEAFLLPPFDEFLLAYRDRSAALDPAHAPLVVPGANGIFNPIVVFAGRVIGTWKRTFRRESVVLTFSPFSPWSAAQEEAVRATAERYATFVGKQRAED